MKISVDFSPPKYPNFLRFKPFGVDATIPVGDLSEDEIEEYAEKYKQGFIAHARKRREEG